MTYLEISRKVKYSFITASFIAFFISILILKFEVNLPFINLSTYLPEQIQGVSSWLYDSIKKILVPISVFFCYFLPSLFIALYINFKLFRSEKETHIRGSKLLSSKQLKKEILNYINKTDDKYRIQIAKENIPVPFTQEVKNFLLIGMVGSGKTQAIYNLLFGSKDTKGIADFNEPMVIYERKGEDFLGCLYREDQDLLFDPRDERTIRWNIFEDMLDDNGEINEAMVDFFVSSVCPISDSKTAHFEEQASSIIKALFLAIAGSENPSNKSMIDFILKHSNPKDLREVLIANETVKLYGVDGLIKGALTVNDNGELDNQGNSVFATCNRVFKNLCKREFYFEESSFSIKSYVKQLEDRKSSSRLFIVNTSLSEGAFNTYFSLFFTLLFKYILSMKNSKTRRVHLVLDELMSLASNKNLGKFLIIKLIDMLAESRSKGVSCIIAFQALSQLSEIVGENLLKSLFQMCGTKIVLQYSEPQGARTICQFLGEKEIERKKIGINKANITTGDRINETEEERLKKLVLESELANLEPLEVFIKIGNFPVSKIHFEYYEPKVIYKGFKKRDIPFFNIEETLQQNDRSTFIA